MNTEVIDVSDKPTEEKPTKSRKIRSEAQLEVLAQARAKAMEARKANQEITRKARELKKYERDEKKREVERLYDEMMAKRTAKEKPTPPPPEKPPPPPEPEPEKPPPPPEPVSRPPSPEPELVHEPEPPKPPVRSYQVKSRGPSQPVAIPQPRAPPAYKAAFEGNFMGYY